MGIKYEYVVVNSWKEMWEKIESKRVDIVPNVGITTKRKEDLSFTQTTDVFNISLFKNKNLKNLKSIDDIKDERVGVVLKNVCTKILDKSIIKNRVLFNDYHGALAALNNNEIDILCYPKTLVEHSIRELNIKNIQLIEKPLKTVKRALAVTKDNEYLLDSLNEKILKIKGDGEYQIIYDKWFGHRKDIEINYDELLMVSLVIISIILAILFKIRSSKLILTKQELNKKIEEIELLNKRELQNQKIILTQSKISAISEVIENIAHQWRQPLTIINANVNLMVADIELDEKISNEQIKNCTKEVMKQSQYLSVTIDNFRDFINGSSSFEKTQNIKKIISKLNSLIESNFKENSITYLEKIEDNIMININENILIQAIINIYNNSKDALTKNINDDNLRYFLVDISKINDEIIIVFKDSGGGIDETIIDKIFEPYFTTKHPSVGTGIGLYMTHQVITKHLKGYIEASNVTFTCQDKILKGAQFRIVIPINKKDL